MLNKYNLNDTQEKYYGVFYKNILSSDLHQIPFNVSIIRVLPSCSTKLHNHHDAEFVTILSGEGEIKLDGVGYAISAGDIFYIKPFNTHIILNNDFAQDLVFTTCWWFIPAQIRNLVKSDIEEKSLIPENVIIISSFPTPNGPLHLGHLSGPFIAEDIYARFLKQHNKSVFMTCGLDQNQTWCGIEGNDMITHSAKIKNTLLNVRFQPDLFITPLEDQEYQHLTKNIFSDLFSGNILYSKMVSVFVCEKTKRYLADSEIIGACPNCRSTIRGNNCETCFLYINDDAIVNPKPLSTNITLGIVKKERIYFPLTRYQKIIKDFISSSTLNSSLKQACLKILNNPLSDIPVTHYYPWGISLDSRFSGQYVCYYFEQITRLIYTLKYVDDVDLQESQVVRFFGIDNVFMYCLFSPALIYSFQPTLLTKLSSNANQYYLLDNQKFSTSRKHAIWADEFIGKWGSNISRLYLAYTRPEDVQNNFNNEDFMTFCGVLKSDWLIWLGGFSSDIKIKFDGKLPEAGSWDSFQKNYFSMLHKSVTIALSYLLPDNFSTREYVHTLLEMVKRAGRLRQKYNSYAESGELIPYFRTAIALQASTAHVLAIICWPVMPDFACRLYNSLGFQGEPIQWWASLPQLLPVGQEILNLSPLLFKDEHESVIV